MTNLFMIKYTRHDDNLTQCLALMLYNDDTNVIWIIVIIL